MKRSRLVLGLLLLAILSLTTCHNSIMETWWEDRTPPIRTPVITPNYTIFRVTFNDTGSPLLPEYELPADQLIVEGGKIARVGTITKSGMGFEGWFVGTNPGASEWDFNDPVTSNLNLYAGWTSSIVTVTFFPNGGGLGAGRDPLSPQVIANGAKISEPPPIRRIDSDGTIWGFGGWWTEDGTNDNWGHLWNFANETVPGSMPLYAKWETPPITVRFVANNGVPEPRQQDLISGTRIVEPLALTREGHAFGGWYTNPGFSGEPWDFSTPVSGNTTLYAQWLPIYFTIKFEAMGGIPAPPDQIVFYGTRIIRPPAMNREGFGFMGWHENTSWNDSDLYDFDMLVFGDRTLYAAWGQPHYIVRFDVKRQDRATIGTPPNQDIGNGLETRIIEPAEPPAPAGWHFYGWTYYPLQALNHPPPLDAPHENRRLLELWDFEDLVSTKTAATFDDNGLNILPIYARWVPNDPNMVWVRSGSFMMGAPGSGTSPVRRVKLNGFYISPYEVTQRLYREVTDWAISNPGLPEYTSATLNHSPSQMGAASDLRPVERVSWYDAVLFCNLMTLKHNAENPSNTYDLVYDITIISRNASHSITDATVNVDWDANGFRLPTEAEWEYAARGGNGSPGNFNFSGSNTADDVAWYNANNETGTHPVGTKAPNGLGIYDMSGNISEWCWDRFSSTYYSAPNNNDNPKGPPSGTTRIRRGGAWSNAVNNVRTVIRTDNAPSQAEWVNGFRVVRYPSVIY